MLDAYRDVAPEDQLDEIRLLAEVLQGRSMQHVNSTRAGGGVAEILRRFVPLTESLGLKTQWDVMTGTPRFFEITKAFHNALQGEETDLSHDDFDFYLETLKENARRLTLGGDVIVIHDPQPAYLPVFQRPDGAQAVWRCHIDVSHPDGRVWRFLRRAVAKYQAAIFHVPQFAQDLPIPQLLIAPSIDPLSDKNRDLTDEEILAVTDRFGIDQKRPLLVQISRFDRFKDPLGVIAAYRLVRQTFDCQLVLAGGGADDDPEGAEVLAQVREAAAGDPDIKVLELAADSHVEINALQRAATVVLQKSLKEGFGLTVSEALWKGKPVIAGAVGGIPTQIFNGASGFLVHSPEGAAFRLRYLLSHPKQARRMGNRGREHVRRNFLITRHLRDYLLLMVTCLHGTRNNSPLLLLDKTVVAVAR